MFGRAVYDKEELISKLENIIACHTALGSIFTFDEYLSLSFAAPEFVAKLAALKENNDTQAYDKELEAYRDRYATAPERLRKSIKHYLWFKCKLGSFDDIPALLERLRG